MFRRYVDKIDFFKHMSWKPETPYNTLPLLPPDLETIETRRVLKACIAARAAVAELKTAGELIPDQGLLYVTLNPRAAIHPQREAT